MLGEQARWVDMILARRRPIGWSTVAPDILPDYGGHTVAGLLGRLGAERIPSRHPVYFEEDSRLRIAELINNLMKRSRYFDLAWICLRVSSVNGAQDAGPSGFVALLTSAQLREVGQRPELRCLLENEINIRSVDPAASVDSSPNQTTLEQQGIEYDEGLQNVRARQGELVLVHTPSNPYSDLLSSSYSYYCVLNPIHRSRLGGDYIIARNVFLESDYPGRHFAIPVRPVFDGRVGPERVVLDTTILLAIGLPQGEPVGLTKALGKATRVRNRVFGDRRGVARVGRTAVVDIEKPDTRVPEELLDLLGIMPGDRIVVEAVSEMPAPDRVTRISLRALAWRDQSPLLIARSRTGVPDNQELVGDEDFPTISLDLVARQRLGISPGSAVYIRPAFSSLLAHESTTVSFVLIAAVFSAAALQSAVLALAAGTIYLTLTLLVVIGRLR